MRAGRRNRRIALERPAMVQNALGEELPGWQMVARVWAFRKDRTATPERIAAGGITATPAVEYEIPFRRGITADMRLEDAGEIWQIAHVSEIGHREGLRLLVERPGV